MSDKKQGTDSGSSAGGATGDSICTAFTRGWMVGKPADLSASLAQVPEDQRRTLLRRLLPLELEFRRATGETPELADYTSQLPDYEGVLSDFFAELSSVDASPGSAASQSDFSETVIRSATQIGETDSGNGESLPDQITSDDMAPSRGEYPSSAEKTLSETDSQIEQTHHESNAPADDPLGETFLTDKTAPVSHEVTRAEDGDTVNVARGKKLPVAGEDFAYELIQEIARGGMGVVFKARQKKLRRIVALKMILSGQLASEQEIKRFYVEAEAAAALDHPNIVPIYEVGEHRGQHFFSMGFVEGDGLDVWAKDSKLTPLDAVRMIRPVADAVQYAHEHGIIHRDLKPANILIDVDGQPRVTDFGLARNLEGDSAMTATGQIMGTPSYMPPEQATGDLEAIGATADIYSLGIILYELLVGRPPFRGTHVLETLELVKNVEPTPPRNFNKAVSRDLDTIILKCLRKSPRERYQTAAELSEELRRILDGEPIQARRIGPIARVWRWCRRKPIVTGLGITTVVAALAITFALSSGRTARDAQTLAELQAGFQTILDEPVLDETWLNSLDQSLSEIAAINASKATDLRTRVDQTYAGLIGRELHRPRLTPDDIAAVETALLLLEGRASDGTTTLRQQLQQRLTDWQLIYELAAPFSNAADTLRYGQQGSTKPVDGKVADDAYVITGSSAASTQNNDDNDSADTVQDVVLAAIEIQNRVLAEAEFEGSWLQSERIGLRMLVAGHAYVFRLHTVRPKAGAAPTVDKNSGAATTTSAVESFTFSDARDAGEPVRLEILRDRFLLQKMDVSVSTLAGAETLQLRAIRDRDLLSFQVNSGQTLEFRDIFPLRAVEGLATCGIEWPSEAGLIAFRISRKATPNSLSPLERGDILYDEQKLVEAERSYHEQAVQTDEELVRQEALTKQALCLLKLNRDAEAGPILANVFSREGKLWPPLAGCQLWAIAVQRDDRQEADAVFSSLTARFEFSEVATAIPQETRDTILKSYLGTMDHFGSVLRNDPDRISKCEQAIVIDRLLSSDGRGSYNAQLQLSRAYRYEDKFDQALESLSDLWERFPDNRTVTRHYSRVLRMVSQFQRALQVLAITRGHLRDQPAHDLEVLLERSRVNAALERWSEAERDVDNVLAMTAQLEREGAPIGWLIHSESHAWLMKGFLQDRRGERAASMRTWRRGFERCRSGLKTLTPENSTVVATMILGSLTNELTTDESMMFVTKSTTAQGGRSPIGAIGVFLNPKTIDNVLRGMWRTERGLRYAELTAYEQLTLKERVRIPMQLAGKDFLRLNGFAGAVSPEQDAAIWDTIQQVFSSVVETGDIKAGQVAQFGLTWKGTTNFLGWGGVAPLLKPKQRASLAYVFAHRFLRLKQQAQAIEFLKTTIRDTPDESLRALAEGDLKLFESQSGRLVLKNDADRDCSMQLKAGGKEPINLTVRSGESVARVLPAADWKLRLDANPGKLRLSASNIRINVGGYGEAAVEDVWSAGDPSRTLPGPVPYPSESLENVGRWQLVPRHSNLAPVTASFSPDGALVATGSEEGLVRIRNTKSSVVVAILPGHSGRNNSVAWSRDGSWLASGGDDHVCRLWATENWTLERSYQSPSGCSRIAFSPKVDEFATLGWDGRLSLWSVDGRLLSETANVPGRPTAIAWSPDGQQLAVSGENGGLRRFRVTSGQVMRPQHVDFNSGVVQMIGWRNAGEIIAADAQHVLHLVRHEKGQWRHVKSWPSQHSQIRMLAWDDNTDRLWTGGWDGHLRQWDVDRPQESLSDLYQAGTTPIARSSEGQVAWVDRHFGLRIGNGIDQEQPVITPSTGLVGTLRISPSGDFYAVSAGNHSPKSDQGFIHVFSASGQSTATVPARAYFFDFLSDNTVVSTTRPSGVVVTSLSDGKRMEVESNSHQITALAAADSSNFAVGYVDGRVRIFSANGSLLSEQGQGNPRVTNLAWSPSGRLATLHVDNKVRISTPEDAKSTTNITDNDEADQVSVGSSAIELPVGGLEGHIASWHPTEDVLAVASRSDQVQLWSPDTGIATEFNGSPGMQDLAWSPDGTRLAVLGWQELRITTRTGDMITRWQPPHRGQLRSIIWSGDGTHLETRAPDAVVRQLDLVPTDDGFDLRPGRLTMILSQGRSVTLSSTGRVESSSGDWSSDVVYLVERPNLSYEMLSPSEFAARAKVVIPVGDSKSAIP